MKIKRWELYKIVFSEGIFVFFHVFTKKYGKKSKKPKTKLIFFYKIMFFRFNEINY